MGHSNNSHVQVRPRIVIASAGVIVRHNPADYERGRKLQDGLVVSWQGKKSFTPTKYDQASLATLTDELKKNSRQSFSLLPLSPL